MRQHLVHDLISLFYPNTCPACGLRLLRGERTVCSICLFKLPATGFENDPENDIVKLFWGRVKLEHAAAVYYFQKGTRIQKLMYRLKYHQRKDIGTWLGLMTGYALKDSLFKVDLVVPVPMHRTRRKMRSYNQASVIAEALALEMDKPFVDHAMRKIRDTGSQTRRTRTDRWERVANSYVVTDKEAVRGRHILLVDDVVTTGATAEACATQLLKVEGTRVSFCAVAAAVD